MKIELNRTQYRDLIKLVMLGARVKEAVLEERGEPFLHVFATEKFLLSRVEDFELDEMIQDIDGICAPSEKLALEIKKTLEEYDEETFWFELETRLGQRDFYATLSKDEREELEGEGETFLPEEVHDLCEKYEMEFEKHGLERLRIQK